MKVKIKVEKEFDIITLQVSAGVRYWEDATINGVEDEKGDLIPCRKDDRWCPCIDIETGHIMNWRTGVEAIIHFKVCDNGVYELEDDKGDTIIKIEGYVPDIMCPKEAGYGDYIIMDVDKDGKINNWKVDIDDFINAED